MEFGEILRTIGDKFANIGKHKEQPPIGDELSVAKISKAASSSKVIQTDEKSTKVSSLSSAKVGRSSSALEKLASAIGNIIMNAIAAIKSGLGIKTITKKAVQHQQSISDQQKAIADETEEILDKVVKNPPDDEFQALAKRMQELQKKSDELPKVAKKRGIKLTNLNRYQKLKKDIAAERKALMDEFNKVLDNIASIPTDVAGKAFEEAEAKSNELKAKEAAIRKEAKEKGIDYDAIDISKPAVEDVEEIDEDTVTADTDTDISDTETIEEEPELSGSTSEITAKFLEDLDKKRETEAKEKSDLPVKEYTVVERIAKLQAKVEEQEKRENIDLHTPPPSSSREFEKLYEEKEVKRAEITTPELHKKREEFRQLCENLEKAFDELLELQGKAGYNEKAAELRDIARELKNHYFYERFKNEDFSYNFDLINNELIRSRKPDFEYFMRMRWGAEKMKTALFSI